MSMIRGCGNGIRRNLRRESSSGTRAQLTAAAGWLAITLGAAHVVVVPLRRRGELAQAWADGWWNAFTLNEPTTLAEAERALTFWQTLGSFGYPMLALGGHLVWSARRGHRVPRWLGAIVLTWGLPFATGMPSSPGWPIPVIGGLIIAGDTDGHAPEPRTPPARLRRRR
jgi:hypothetical protein